MSDYPKEVKVLEDEEFSKINPWDLVEPILKNKWAVALIITVSIIGGFLYNLRATRIYAAQSSVVIRRNYPTPTIKNREADIPDKINTFWDFNTKVNMITSRPLTEELVNRLIEKGYYKEHLEQLGFEKMSEEEKDRIIRNKAAGIRGGLKARDLKDTNIVVISYQHSNPHFARDVVNILAEIAVEYDRKEKALILQNSLAYLKGQMDEAREKVEEYEAKLYDYRLKHNIFNTEMDRNLLAKRRSDLVDKLTAVHEEIQELESKISQLNNLMGREGYTRYTPVLSDNPTMLTLSQSIVDTEIKYDALLIRYQEKHPEVMRAKQEVAILQEKFEEEIIKTRTRLEYSLNVLRSRETLLKDALAQTEQNAIVSTEKDIEYVVLERDATSAKDLYKTLLAAVKEVSINTNTLTEYVMYVHEKAIVPKWPIKPNTSLNMLISLVLGLFFAGVYAFGREYLDQTVRHPDDIKKMLGLPVLTTVPLHSHKTDEERSIMLHVSHRPKSLFSESITALRSYLNIKLPQERSLAIQITSSAPREGKSLISSNLATSMAIEGRKTLIVDADLHHPVIHKAFKMENTIGLYNLIVDALNPRLSDIDMDKMSLGDIRNLVRLKQWSGTMKIQWDSLDLPLKISFKEGKPIGANIKEWKERFTRPGGFPPPENLTFYLDESEIIDLDSHEHTGKQALEFIEQYPKLIKSKYFIEVAVKDYISHTEIKNLDILTAGTNAKNPSEVLGSEQMKILLEILKQKYDRIIIDSPPAFPLSDVSVLSPMTDGVLWICRSGEIPKTLLQRNIQHIQQVQPNIIGVVINALDLHRDRYYYYGYSSYYYYRRYYKYRYSYYYGEHDGLKDKDDHSLPPAAE